MHEDDLRALIRDAIARHLGGTLDADGRARRAGPTHLAVADGRDGSPSRPSPHPNGRHTEARSANAPYLKHLSHGRFVFLAPTDPDAPCVVEPQVRCHHCGFCQSYGH